MFKLKDIEKITKGLIMEMKINALKNIQLQV